MLRWLLDLIARTFRRPEPFHVYRPGERLIYEYFDGREMVRVDPMVLYKKIMSQALTLERQLKVSRSIHSDADRMRDELLSNVRGIFGVKPFEQGGLTESETFGLLDHFMDFTEELKKNSRPSPTPSPSTGGSESSSAESPPTPSSSASGSTGSGSSTDRPGPSPSGSASPSGPSTPDLNTTAP